MKEVFIIGISLLFWLCVLEAFANHVANKVVKKLKDENLT